MADRKPDRTEPPEGYVVEEMAHLGPSSPDNEHVWQAVEHGDATRIRRAHPNRQSAVAACWEHHDRILAKARETISAALALAEAINRIDAKVRPGGLLGDETPWEYLRAVLEYWDAVPKYPAALEDLERAAGRIAAEGERKGYAECLDDVDAAIKGQPDGRDCSIEVDKLRERFESEEP